jgi:Ca2+-binding RTX toxin-like protein
VKRRHHLSMQLTLVLIILSGLVALGSTSAVANPHPGQSVNVAIVGSPSVINGGTLPTSGPAGDLGDFAFTNFAPASVSATSLAPFDTVVLNVASPEMGCTTDTLSATAKADLVSFVGGGEKMIIYDSECAAGTGVDYTWLPFPFITNNPGATGAHGTLTIVEQNLLSTSDPADPHFIDAAFLGSSTDAVGDANVVVTNDPNLCVAMTGTNAGGVTGAVHTYAKYSVGTNTGLFIYNGLDVDVLGSEGNPNGLGKLWLQELQQPLDPSNLPCGFTVVGITLAPSSASNVIGSDHTVTAALTDLLGNPKPGLDVTFSVVSGPNNGAASIATTDASGKASFTYTGSGGVGTDSIEACFYDEDVLVCSQRVTKEWKTPPCTITGTAGNDVLYGTRGDDIICGLAGNDRLFGKGGNDELLGGDGKDKLAGGDGKDKLIGGAGKDRLAGGDGTDELLGEDGNDGLAGGDGKDKLIGGNGNDELSGEDGNDELLGEGGNDELEGGDGRDRVVGGDGNDELAGGDGNDRLEGGPGDDRLHGDRGNDVLTGDSGDDVLHGGRQSDELVGGQGNDHCNGGPATDTVDTCEVVTGIP